MPVSVGRSASIIRDRAATSGRGGELSPPLPYAVRFLDDTHEPSPLAAVEAQLPASALKPAGRKTPTIGLVGWSSASEEELGSLAELRREHEGPLVAILATVPRARGARVIAARLDGAVMAADLARTLRPTLAAVAVGQCVVPR